MFASFKRWFFCLRAQMSRQSRKIFTRRKKTPDKSRRRAKPPESTLEFEHNESNILPSILKTDFLERSIIKFLPNENSCRHLSSGRVMPHMPSAASLCRATSRRARALFLALTLPQHPRPPDCAAIYEKFVFASRARHPAHISRSGIRRRATESITSTSMWNLWGR